MAEVSAEFSAVAESYADRLMDARDALTQDLEDLQDAAAEFFDKELRSEGYVGMEYLTVPATYLNKRLSKYIVSVDAVFKRYEAALAAIRVFEAARVQADAASGRADAALNDVVRHLAAVEADVAARLRLHETALIERQVRVQGLYAALGKPALPNRCGLCGQTSAATPCPDCDAVPAALRPDDKSVIPPDTRQILIEVAPPTPPAKASSPAAPPTMERAPRPPKKNRRTYEDLVARAQESLDRIGGGWTDP